MAEQQALALPAAPPAERAPIVRCVRVGSTIRVLSASPCSHPGWHCTFPRHLRRDGAIYAVGGLTEVGPALDETGKVVRRGYYAARPPYVPLPPPPPPPPPAIVLQERHREQPEDGAPVYPWEVAL